MSRRFILLVSYFLLFSVSFQFQMIKFTCLDYVQTNDAPINSEYFSFSLQEDDCRLELNDLGLMNIYVINLRRHIDRLNNLIGLFSELKLPFTVFEAYDGIKIRDSLKEKTYIDFMFHPSIKMNLWQNYQFFAYKNYEGWQELGAWQSHLNIYLHYIEESKKGDERPILILEDDIKFVQGFKNHLKHALNSIPSDWNMLFLGYCYENLTRINENFSIINKAFCAHGYVLKDSTVAQTLVQYVNTAQSQGPDHKWNKLFNKEIKAYAYHPEIILQDHKKFKSNVPTSSRIIKYEQ